jgi:phosphopantothenoylcysteine decarboxylase/phosphopantothenate--cysteine ligase
MICANDVSQSGLGFNSDQNALTLYWQNKQLELPVSSKSTIALKVIEQLAKHLEKAGNKLNKTLTYAFHLNKK